MHPLSKKHMTTALLAGLISTLGFADSPPPGQVTIDQISYFGSGCPEGSVAENLSDDAQAMTLLFDDFLVASDEQPNQSRVQKNCKVKIDMNIPEGWSYGLFCVDFRGYASLDENITGKQTTNYSFAGRGGLQIGHMEKVGPFDDDYSKVTAIPLTSVRWSPCGSGSIESVELDTTIAIEKPAPINFEWHRAHHEAVMAKVRFDILYHRARSKVGRNAPLTNTLKSLRDQADQVRDRLARRRPTEQATQLYLAMKPSAEQTFLDISVTPQMMGDRTVQREFPNLKGHFETLGRYIAPAGQDAHGLMTVDSIDGELKHHYGIAWKRCDGSNCTSEPQKVMVGAGVIANIVKHSPYNADGSLSQQQHTNVAWDDATIQKVCEMAGYRTVAHKKRHNFSSCRDDNVMIYDRAGDRFNVVPGCQHRSMVKELTCTNPINSCQ